MLDSETNTETTSGEVTNETTIDQSNDWFLGGLKPSIPEATAQKEVLDWLNFKNLSVRRRKDKLYSINLMVAAIQDGDLARVDGKWVQNLRIPIGTITQLKYEDRQNTGDFQSIMKQQKIDPSDSPNVLAASVSALTGLTFAQCSKLEEEDKDLAHAYALFFN